MPKSNEQDSEINTIPNLSNSSCQPRQEWNGWEAINQGMKKKGLALYREYVTKELQAGRVPPFPNDRYSQPIYRQLVVQYRLRNK